MTKPRILAVVLMTAALLLAAMGVVSADLKTTNVLRSWDDGTNKYENGNITMHLDSNPQPFYTQLDFDGDQHADACGTGTQSVWAGDTFVGLYHVDNNPPGAPGFQSTQNWQLVKCSAFDNPATKYPAASDVIATWQNAGSPAMGVACVLRNTKDTVTPCTSGNCQDEIQTKFHVTEDTNCDGTPEPEFTVPGGVCLYWEAIKPPNTLPTWGGNIQVRYSADNDTLGGDKTINFKEPAVVGPTAVTISSLAAKAEPSIGSLGSWVAALVLAAAAVFTWLRAR